MLKEKKQYIVIALILSGLVHALLFFYVSKTQSVDIQNYVPSVSIQVDIVNLQKLPAKLNDNQLKSESHMAEQIIHRDNSEYRLADLEMNHQSSELQKSQRNEAIMNIASDYQMIQLEKHAGLDGHVDQLSQLVYQEINRKKRYPYLAKRQRREGLVKLSFILHPDGKVTDVSVVESSRFSVLDRAAQKAVKDISPFLLAADYLNYQQAFNVDVDFRLGKI